MSTPFGAIRITRKCIDKLAEEFQDCALNFLVEESLAARLLELLRSEPELWEEVPGHRGKLPALYKVQRAHVEWPAEGGGRYDLVIWDHPSTGRAPRLWGSGSAKRGKDITLDIVVEIKHRRNNLSTEGAWWGKDMAKLGEALRAKRAKRAVYLIFIDNDETDQNWEQVQQLRARLRDEKTHVEQLEIACVFKSDKEGHWL